MKKTTLALAALARTLMRTPLLLRVNQSEDGRKITLTTTRPDMPRVIGGNGESIYALQRVAKDIGVELKLNEPEDLAAFECIDDAGLDIYGAVRALHEAVEDPVAFDESDGRLRIARSQLPPGLHSAMLTLVRKAARNANRQDLEVMYV